jgi:ecdysone receptor
MDVKHEFIYRVGGGAGGVVNSIMKAGLGGVSATGSCLADELILSSVKTEPRVQSPCDPGTGTTAPSIELGHHLAPSATATSGVTPSSSGSATTPNGGGLFSGIASSNKRHRTDDWLPSPSSGSVGPLPPLTPSPGPQGHPYTGINGYSSPLSSGSYDPYSPNGKIGKYIHCSCPQFAEIKAVYVCM